MSNRENDVAEYNAELPTVVAKLREIADALERGVVNGVVLSFNRSDNSGGSFGLAHPDIGNGAYFHAYMNSAMETASHIALIESGALEPCGECDACKAEKANAH